MSPYGGTTPEQDAKIERCIAGISGINKRTGKPYTEQEKIMICKAQVMGTRKFGIDFKQSGIHSCPKCGENMIYDDGRDAYVCKKCGYIGPNGPRGDV
jgi:predicted RNA-binding Zn-ribbon protein involved in translation (DUF1610 family)